MNEKSEKSNLEWGQDFRGTDGYSPGLRCTNQKCETQNPDYPIEQISREYHSKIAAGVRKSRSHARKNRPYILTCECPECFDKFWFHISGDEAESLFEKYAEK